MQVVDMVVGQRQTRAGAPIPTNRHRAAGDERTDIVRTGQIVTGKINVTAAVQNLEKWFSGELIHIQLW